MHKAVSRAEARAVRPSQAYVRARNRLERWVHGDKEGLWREVMEAHYLRQGKRRGVASRAAGAIEERVAGEAGLGRVGKAVQAFLSPGVAPDTPKVRRALGKKFPSRRLVVDGDGGALPQAAGGEVEDFIKEVKSFRSGAGAGPSGLRPQFVKEMGGEAGDDPCVQAMCQVTALFIEG